MDAIVLQLEIPLETVAHAIRRGRSWGVPVILDAGPPCPNPPKEFFDVDVLSPNEAEAAALTGMAVGDDESAEAAAREMLRRGARAVVIKRGGKGALLATEKECVRLPAHRVNVVDTTAAGDAFTAALAVRLAEGADLRSAVETANRAGALACARFGAQPSMPTRSECEALG